MCECLVRWGSGTSSCWLLARLTATGTREHEMIMSAREWFMSVYRPSHCPTLDYIRLGKRVGGIIRARNAKTTGEPFMANKLLVSHRRMYIVATVYSSMCGVLIALIPALFRIFLHVRLGSSGGDTDFLS